MRTRQTYQCDAVLTHLGDVDPASNIPSNKIVQLHRIQDGSFGHSIQRDNIFQWGQLGRIDTISLSKPDVSADFTYYLHDFKNEKALGFNPSATLDESFTKNLLSTSADNTAESEAVTKGKNFYLLTCEQGNDANIGGLAVGHKVSAISLTGAFISDYNVEASVGSIPTASFSITAQNNKSENTTVVDNSGSSGAAQELVFDNGYVVNDTEVATNVTVDATGATGTALTTYVPDGSGYEPVTALKPGDIVLDIGNSGILAETIDGQSFAGSTGMHIQSFSLNIPLSRTPLERLGDNFAFSEEVEYPIEVTVNVSAILADFKDGSVLDELLSPTKNDLTITFKDRAGADKMKYKIVGCQYQNENYSQNIGGQRTVDITFTAQIGGPDDTTNGVFAYGEYDTGLFNYDV